MTDADYENEISHLKFDHPNVGYVIDGLEDATVRYDLEREFEEGEWVQARTPENNVFGYIEIEEVWTGPLRLAYSDMTVVDERKHPSSNAGDLHRRMEKHYDRTFSGGEEVTVVYFELVQVGSASRESTRVMP